ncbi:hypothetical protein V6N11_034750 [Hibiscus sabdariffa]|uniref:Uncharacterized protein n=1 Tax=Hibiscus sabdariffa TaxID=183260 RepID=A0ABR2NS83_9ROSI
MTQNGSISEGLHTRKMTVPHKVHNLNEDNPSKIGTSILTETVDPKSINLADSGPLTSGWPKSPSDQEMEKLRFNGNYLLLSLIKDTPDIGVEDDHRIVIVVPRKPQKWHKLPFPMSPKVMEVERIRGKEWNVDPSSRRIR